jgi:hypothetical protein
MTPDEISRSMREDPWRWLELPADPHATTGNSSVSPIRHSFGSGRRGKPPASPDDPPRPRASSASTRRTT